jgi:hypothetical protein
VSQSEFRRPRDRVLDECIECILSFCVSELFYSEVTHFTNKKLHLRGKE